MKNRVLISYLLAAVSLGAHYCSAETLADQVPGRQADVATPTDQLDEVVSISGHYAEIQIADPDKAKPPSQLYPANAEQLMQAGLHQVAIRRLTTLLNQNPNSVRLRMTRANVEEKTGQFRQALEDYDALIEQPLRPPLNWYIRQKTSLILAMAPDNNVRNGKRAVQLAEEAMKLTNNPPIELYDALAAAYAEVGDTQRAGQVLRSALERYPTQLDPVYEQRLERYDAGKPLRDRANSK